MFAGIYCGGGMYGGSTTLDPGWNTPGEARPSSPRWRANKMARKGCGGLALATAAIRLPSSPG